MKNALRVVGLIVFPMVLFGALFKIQHWPGASILLILGLSSVSIGFAPVFMGYVVQTSKDSMEKAGGLGLGLSMMVLSIGLLFKVQHYPGASIMMILGTLALCGAIIPIMISSFKNGALGNLLLWIVVGTSGLMVVLAVNVSKEVLQAFTITEYRSNIGNEALRFSLEQKTSSSNNPQVLEVHARSMSLYNHINATKGKLADEADQNPSGTFATSGYDSRFVMNKDNQEVGTWILSVGGYGPRDEFSADSLLANLEEYRDFTLGIMGPETEGYAVVEELFSYPNMMNYGIEMDWADAMFYHQPLVSNFQTLTLLQHNILIAESLVLADLEREGGNSDQE